MDLESRNGTYVRSDGGSFSRVGEEHALQNGDEVALGNARFRFEISNAGEESSEPRA
jgi:pSer/pThr/pTyr-binding forkhead associated (FHA) protein